MSNKIPLWFENKVLFRLESRTCTGKGLESEFEFHFGTLQIEIILHEGPFESKWLTLPLMYLLSVPRAKIIKRWPWSYSDQCDDLSCLTNCYMMFGKRKFYLQDDLSDGRAKKERNRERNIEKVKERKRKEGNKDGKRNGKN